MALGPPKVGLVSRQQLQKLRMKKLWSDQIGLFLLEIGEQKPQSAGGEKKNAQKGAAQRE